MGDKTYRWIKIASSPEELDFSANDLCGIYVNEKNICIGRKNNEIFAFSSKCPHASGYLPDGYIDALGHVVCPVHRYKFNMKNGRNTSGEGYYLKTYPLQIREDGVYLGM